MLPRCRAGGCDWLAAGPPRLDDGIIDSSSRMANQQPLEYPVPGRGPVCKDWGSERVFRGFVGLEIEWLPKVESRREGGRKGMISSRMTKTAMWKHRRYCVTTSTRGPRAGRSKSRGKFWGSLRDGGSRVFNGETIIGSEAAAEHLSMASQPFCAPSGCRWLCGSRKPSAVWLQKRPFEVGRGCGTAARVRAGSSLGGFIGGGGMLAEWGTAGGSVLPASAGEGLCVLRQRGGIGSCCADGADEKEAEAARRFGSVVC